MPERLKASGKCPILDERCLDLIVDIEFDAKVVPAGAAARLSQAYLIRGMVALAMSIFETATSDEVLAAYRGDLDALRRCFDPALNALQLSRASYLDIVMREQVDVDTITDSLEREERQNALMDEKMELFAALEQGRLVLGDTLLHIAVRLGYEDVIDFLVLTDHPPSTGANTTQTPNFKGELPEHVAGANRFVQLFLGNVSDVHEVFGFEYRSEPRVHRLVHSLRRVWPLWMFDGQQEAGNLVRVLFSARSSDPAFGNLVKVAHAVGERFRLAVSSEGVQLALQFVRKHDGDALAARRVLATEWTSDDKRRTLFERVFRRWFRSWRWRRNEERDKAYVDFFDTAMDAWLQLVQDQHLASSEEGARDDGGNPDAGDPPPSALAPVDGAVLKRYELQIWKRRVRPALAYVDDLCAHISALESYLELAHLQVS
ncbi:hypothetical protein PybrP1_003306 [[Pythium] brassicae (nom. inval.)]|nr:hypothetical protein PybrP1_003306 [[Pythium] brassicae (nom. inval.)]